jgi:uncharacterized membrane protein
MQPVATQHTLLAVGWAIIASYAAWSFGGQQALAALLDPFGRNLVEQSLLTAFFLVHAAGGLRAKEIAAYALICFVISNLLENLSVTTGFPFGAFHHSEATGPRLFNIPWLATPTYMAMGYVSWTIAQVLADRTRPIDWTLRVTASALIGAFVFSMWDLCNDPVFHTMNKAFFYDHPGPWFGVPLSNFAGWLLTAAAIHGLFALWLARRPRQSRMRDAPPTVWWRQAVVMYALVAAAGIWRNLHGREFQVVLPNGDAWRSADLYGSMTLVTVFTMGFVVLLAWLRLAPDASVREIETPRASAAPRAAR